MSSASLADDATDDLAPDWVRPIVRESLSERAYRELREALMRGRLPPNAKLLLRPTSARFGISATPMREALLRLVSEKGLTLDARGTVVVPTLTLDQLLEIRAIRADLEGRAAAAAASHTPAAEIDALAALHARISECHAGRDFARAVDLNTEFHLSLCRMGRLPILREIVEMLWVRCGPILSHLYDEGVPDWEPHPHRRIIDALRRGDADGARAAVRDDIEFGGRGLLAHVGASGTDAGAPNLG